MMGNCSLPDVRLLYSQPLIVTFSPTCCGRSLILTFAIKEADYIGLRGYAGGRARGDRRTVPPRARISASPRDHRQNSFKNTTFATNPSCAFRPMVLP